jgi:hypothetical protein
MENESKLPIYSVMTKKRYNSIAKLIESISEDKDKADECMKRIAEIMKYDPNKERNPLDCKEKNKYNIK